MTYVNCRKANLRTTEGRRLARQVRPPSVHDPGALGWRGWVINFVDSQPSVRQGQEVYLSRIRNFLPDKGQRMFKRK